MIHVTNNQRELLGQQLPHGSSSSSSSGDTHVVHAALVHSHKEMLLRAVDTAHTNSRTASGSTWPATKAHSPQALAPWKGWTSERAAEPLPRVPKPPWGWRYLHQLHRANGPGAAMLLRGLWSLGHHAGSGTLLSNAESGALPHL